MSVFKKAKCAKLAWILVCALFSICTSLNAHVLTETSAQVILRDGQIEVKVLTDIEHLISSLQNDQAWLLGDIDSIMPQNLSLSEQDTFTKNALKQKMHLVVNDQVIGIEAVMLERDSNSHEPSKSHNKEIVFQARHSFAQITSLSISFHKSLGAVHTSFVKPQYRLINAGEITQMVF
tara:strand:- start:1197 stop:1730 length:534 start_codon:yes stop_codon:yes gene_type:complete